MSKKEKDVLIAMFERLPKADRTFLMQLAHILQDGAFSNKDAVFLVRLSASLAEKHPRQRRSHLRLAAGDAT
jgi:hypothetical protein